MSVVLDSSAVLALLWAEPGADRVEAEMEDAVISAVNYAELSSKLHDRGGSTDQVAQVLDALGLDVVAFDAAQAAASGMLRPATRAGGLSLGDRSCLALASVSGATALTADRAWADLDIDVAVEVIR